MAQKFESFAETVAERRTCRQFLPNPVPRLTIERILDAARYAPSWCNTQPWQLVVTSGDSTVRFRTSLLEHLMSGAADGPDIAFPERYEGSFRERRIGSAVQLYESLGIARDDRAGSGRQALRNYELFDAPHVAILTTEAALGTYGAVDCGVYLNTFLLAAATMGVATAPQAALATCSSFLHDYFDIPEHRLVVAGISFGYADTHSPVNQFRTPRVTTEEAVTWHE